MNQLVKEKWIAALRSGEYKQAHTQLKHGDNFCCLGVLTDLYLKEHNKEWETEEDYPDEPGDEFIAPSDSDSFLAYNELPADAVMEWAELKTLVSPTRGEEYYIINDEYNLTFNEIADIIEEDYKNEA